MPSKTNRMEELADFYHGKTVFLTGIHGFKGSWLASLLLSLGVERLVGVGLPSANDKLFNLLDFPGKGVEVHTLDVREHDKLVALMGEVNPDVVFHLAAQPIVAIGYSDPYYTFSSNTMGTVNILDSVRALPNRTSVVMVTTDKVYFNAEQDEGYNEEALLLGQDPYSASKSAAEHAIYSFKKSYFDATLLDSNAKIVSPCRAGNVIGGGDFSPARLVPDLAAAWVSSESVSIRDFQAVRPYEHVLDAVFAYVILAKEQWADTSVAGAYNIGPNDESLMANGEVIDYFTARSALEVVDVSTSRTFHETKLLKLDSGKFRRTFSWAPTWPSKEDILSVTFDWYKAWVNGEKMDEVTLEQIRSFLND